MATAQPQQINITDLDIQQLAEVRRQLEEASPPPSIDPGSHAITSRN